MPMAMPKLEGKVLITGASGFIGEPATGRAAGVGVRCRCDSQAGLPAFENRPVDRWRRITRASTDLERIVSEEKPNYVLHVAGATKGSSYEDFRLGNVMPTRNLLTAVQTRAPRTLKPLRAGLVR